MLQCVYCGSLGMQIKRFGNFEFSLSILFDEFILFFSRVKINNRVIWKQSAIGFEDYFVTTVGIVTFKNA